MHRSAVVMAGLLLLASCSDSNANSDGGRTTVPTASSSTSTTAVSYEVPATIDAAYIEKVMAALDHLDGEAARRAAIRRQLDEEFFSYYVAIYTDKYFNLVKEAWIQVAADDFSLLPPRPGDPKTTVERILRADPECVLFQAKRDYTAQLLGPAAEEAARYVALVRLPPDRNPSGRNPTPWIMSLDGRNSDGSEPKPEDVCRVR